ncbi:hypothetical protein CJ030_MR6G016532 [Morella rubra]|uniref:Uncharacterized protein n=1 Tax=Morella rubra TaxID=262757 RepID=A0A6A1VA52_9ROSI|nr:hypothetical protein CJ030_MR6G016532 [Morella rubra]
MSPWLPKTAQNEPRSEVQSHRRTDPKNNRKRENVYSSPLLGTVARKGCRRGLREGLL